LIGINERVRLMNGKLELQSSPGAGTRLEVIIPLDEDGPGAGAGIGENG